MKSFIVTVTGTQKHISSNNSKEEFFDFSKAVRRFFSEVDRFDDVEERPEWPQNEKPLYCDCRDYIVELTITE